MSSPLFGFLNCWSFSADGWNSLLMLQDCLEKAESQTDWSFSENPQVCIISTTDLWKTDFCTTEWNAFLTGWKRLNISINAQISTEFGCSFSQPAGLHQSIFYSESRDRTSTESGPIHNPRETVFLHKHFHLLITADSARIFPCLSAWTNRLTLASCKIYSASIRFSKRKFIFEWINN